MHRRTFLLGAASAAALAAKSAAAQQHPQHHAGPPPASPSPEPYAKLQGGVPHHMTAEQEAQRVTDSPAPPGPAGRWAARAALPLPRSEMAWATSWDGKMYIVGGYGEGRVDRAYNHIYDPQQDQWFNGAPLPRGANHVAVAADAGRVYAMGGFIEQNRNPDRNAYVYDIAADRWTPIAPLPRPRGAAAAVVLGGKIYLIGGATEPTRERASIGWNEVYDPQSDSWTQLKPLPGARDHAGCVAHEGRIHIIGGRFNTFEYNTGLHHIYLPDEDTWKERAALPTPRSGHGLVVYRGRIYAMGGESGVVHKGKISEARVFGQMESYDAATDSWQSHAPMPTPRHAVGATVLGDWIHVAGGGAVTGGAVQSAIHEAFTLG
jgi:N-acetylneuraminic acid mutarotase